MAAVPVDQVATDRQAESGAAVAAAAVGIDALEGGHCRAHFLIGHADTGILHGDLHELRIDPRRQADAAAGPVELHGIAETVDQIGRASCRERVWQYV